MEHCNIEEWRVIPSEPSLEASSLGRIRVRPYEKPMPYGGTRIYKGRPVLGCWDGKRYIFARKKRKTLKVARLVCEAFHGLPPEGKPHCLHEDENSRNNQPSNLKWGSQKENLNYPGFIAYCQKRTGEHNPYVKGRAIKSQRGRPARDV